MALPLVLVPGLGSDGAVWEPTIAALGDAADCTVGDTLHDDSLAAMAARILAAAPDRFALAGVSMGGMVAFEIMRSAPERVTRLALVDTNARPDSAADVLRRHATNAAVAVMPDFAVATRAGLGSLVAASASTAVGDAIVAMGVRVGSTSYIRQNSGAAARADARPVLATIAVPTVVVIGEHDTLTPLELSREIADGIAGAQLHVIPACGHLPPIEAPAALAAILRDWLA